MLQVSASHVIASLLFCDNVNKKIKLKNDVYYISV